MSPPISVACGSYDDEDDEKQVEFSYGIFLSLTKFSFCRSLLPSVRLYLAVAVASDTAMALGIAHESSCNRKCAPLSLLVTAQDVHMVLSPCIDTIVTLRHLPNNDNSDTSPWKLKHNHGDDMSDVDDDDDDHFIAVTSVWSAHICSSPYTSPETMEEHHTIIKYAVVQKSAGADGAGGDRELRWKPDRGGTVEGVDV